MYDIQKQSGKEMGGNIGFGIQWRAPRQPESHIYLFNISRRNFFKVGNVKMDIPGIDTLDRKGKSQKKTLPGLEDKPYRLITSFPDPILCTRENFNSNELDFVEQSGLLFVVDLIHPDLASIGSSNLDLELPADKTFAEGRNIARAGVFYDFEKVPSKDALEKAYARLERYYGRLLENARVLGLQDKTKLQEQLRDNPDYILAAEFVDEEFEWCKKQVRAITCDRCGEKTTTKRKFHKTSEGFFCVEQSIEAWKDLYNMGQITKERVPEDFQWWKKAKPKVEEIEPL